MKYIYGRPGENCHKYGGEGIFLKHMQNAFKLNKEIKEILFSFMLSSVLVIISVIFIMFIHHGHFQMETRLVIIIHFLQ